MFAGELVDACAVLDVDIVHTYSTEYNDLQHQFSSWIDRNHYGSNITDFNDNDETTWPEVVSVLRHFITEVCA